MSATHSSLNVIALISGGKDSFFALLHCLALGHKVVALANVYPPFSSSSEEEEDPNSFMYQTAGHQLISLYPKALNLPLYRNCIVGRAKDDSKDYNSALDPKNTSSAQAAGKEDSDEVECLVPLLQEVLAAHPEANAICSGAILSTYQRTRIESVALRLGLIPLCYLWQYPSLPPPSPGGLLDDMAAVGLDVRIVKVATGGLDESFLWHNLMEKAVRQRVERAMSRFGGSILGEGGEYETLVLNGRNNLWKGRLDVRSQERVIRRGSGGEAWIEFKELGGTVQKNSPKEPTSQETERQVRKPVLYDQQFSELLCHLEQNFPKPKVDTLGKQLEYCPREWTLEPALIQGRSNITISNMTAPNAGTAASEQMLTIKEKLLKIIAQDFHLSPQSIVFTTILLRSMTDFPSVNEVYGQLFTHPNPPARVTVACGDTLPPNVEVMVSFVISRVDQREGLHVQSRSYWAPANIGPYSQAVSVPMDKDNRVVYVAGQIPLVPASMDRVQGPTDAAFSSFREQTCLALQHLWRIGRVVKVGWWLNGIAFLAGDDIEAKATLAWEAWRQVHNPKLWINEDEEDAEDNVDIWDRVHGGYGGHDLQRAQTASLPDFSRLRSATEVSTPAFLAVHIYELPRACDIEWQSSGIEFSRDDATLPPDISSHLYVKSEDNIKTQLESFLGAMENTEDTNAIIYTSRPDLVQHFKLQIVPCRSLWGPGGSKLAAGIFQSRPPNP